MKQLRKPSLTTSSNPTRPKNDAHDPGVKSRCGS
jgi:hypothetical protein